MTTREQIVSWLSGEGHIAAVTRGAGAIFTIQVIGNAFRYGAQILLARWMGPAEYGVYVYAIAWASLIAAFAICGLDSALLKFVPEYLAKAQWSYARGLIRWSMVIVFVIGCAAAVVAIPLVVKFGSSVHSRVVLLALMSVPLGGVMALNEDLLRGLHRATAAYGFASLVRPGILLAGVTGIWWFTGRATAAEAVVCANGALLAVVVMEGLLIVRSMPAQLRDAVAGYEHRRWLEVALSLAASSWFTFVMSDASTVLVGYLLGASQAGLYSVALRTAAFVSFPLFAVNALAAPLFSTLFTSGRQGELQMLVEKCAHVIFWPSLAIGLVLLIFSGQVLRLFGSDFVTAAPELSILVVAQLFNAGTGSVGYLLQMTGFHRECIYVFGITAAADIVLSIVLINLLGTVGAALATGAAIVVFNFWLHWLVGRHLSVRPSIVHALALMATGS